MQSQLTHVKPHMPRLKDQHGSILLTVIEQIAEWQKYYECPNETTEEVEAENKSELKRRNNPNRSITTEPASIAEIKVAISRLKLHNAAGADGNLPELLKYGAEEVAPVLKLLLLEIWKTNKIPKDWK